MIDFGQKVHNVLDVMTTSRFAALPSAWPEYFFGPPFTHHRPSGGLLMRVHPNCNRASGDEDVLARAIVFQNDEYTKEQYYHSSDVDICETYLRRLTIRERHIDLDYQELMEYESEREYMWPHFQERVEMYRLCLEEILGLKPIDLGDPWRNMRSA